MDKVFAYKTSLESKILFSPSYWTAYRRCLKTHSGNYFIAYKIK